jgi:hypothetical protein
MFAFTDIETLKVTAKNDTLQFDTGKLPKHIVILNLTTGARLEWTKVMNDGEAFVTSAGGGAGGVGLKTANGITLVQDEVDANGVGLTHGFRLGALADFNDTTTEELSVTFAY